MSSSRTGMAAGGVGGATSADLSNHNQPMDLAQKVSRNSDSVSFNFFYFS